MRNIYLLLSVLLFSIFLIPNKSNSQVFWEERISGLTVSLNCVSNIDGLTAWICGDSSTVLKTTNYGYNWINLSLNGIPANTKLISIYGINSSIALTAGFRNDTAYLYRTSNGGYNWVKVFSEKNGYFNSIQMNDSLKGFLFGNPVAGRWSIRKTTNGGINWDSTGLFLSQYYNEKGYKRSAELKDSLLIFSSDSSRLYLSSNGGLAWQFFSTLPETTVTSVSIFRIANNNQLYIAGRNLKYTTNMGVNWIPFVLPGSGFVSVYKTPFSFLFGSYFSYCKGSNIYGGSGTYYTVSYTAPSGNYNHMEYFRNFGSWGPGAIYAVRDNGGVSRGNLVIDAIIIISSKIPDSYSVEQNYPNPFNSTTKIRFDTRVLPNSLKGEMRGGFVSLKIYNLLGQEITELVGKVIQPGQYEAIWDAGNLPSGVYFYRYYITNPNTNEVVYNVVRKMVLTK